MLENYEVIDSRICEASIIGSDYDIMDIDMSIVCKDGKYGVVYTSHADGESELIVPCEYDNIYFTELWLNTYCVAVSGGKSGLFKVSACKNGNVETAVAEQIVPCIYERIESCYPYHLFYGRKTVRWFDHNSGKTSAEYDSIVPIGQQHLLCTVDDESKLWDHLNAQYVFTLPEDGELIYIGVHGNDFVFRLKYYEHWSEQLLFCNKEGNGIRFSPRAENIKIYLSQDELTQIVGIELSWGDKDESLSKNIIDMLVGDFYE